MIYEVNDLRGLKNILYQMGAGLIPFSGSYLCIWKSSFGNPKT